MAYFCLSHNHNDFIDLNFYIIAKTLSYTDDWIAKANNDGEGDRPEAPFKSWKIQDNTYINVMYGPANPETFNSSFLSGKLADTNEQVQNTIDADWDKGSACPTVVEDLPFIYQGAMSNDIYGGGIHYPGVIDPTGITWTPSNIANTYDTITGAGAKVIFLTWDDFTHASWTTTFKAREQASRTKDSNTDITDAWWAQRTEAMIKLKTLHPDDSKNFQLCQDLIIAKNTTHYEALCTFMGADPVTESTWHGWVDTYNNYIAS